MFEIGYSLKAARERQGIGFPEAELATKIRAKYIRALEEEDFATLPADTYARGFLRTYAEYLGLDGEIYVDEYASRFHNADWEDEPAVPRRRPRQTRRERTIERRAVVLALAFVAVLAALTVGAWVYGNVPSSSTGHIELRGVGSGTFVVLRESSRTGQLLFSGKLTRGRVEQFPGTSFYVHARTQAGVRITHSAGVTVLGG